MNIDATVKFADLVDGVVKLGALVLVGYAVARLLPIMGQRGFTAKIFGNEVKLNGPTDAVETLSATFKKQIDDLRAQVIALKPDRSVPEAALGTEHKNPLPPETPETAHQIPPTRTVLWADDNPVNNLFEVGKLREAGFVVTQVTSTDAAVAELQKARFDLVVTDMSRREHGHRIDDAGIRLVEWIHNHDADEGRSQTPVFIYCSAWAVAHYGDDALARGATGVTASTTELLSGIREAFRSTPDSTDPALTPSSRRRDTAPTRS